MNFTELCNEIFDKAIAQYHIKDDVDVKMVNPFPKDSLEYLLFAKTWIDIVQWHLEDIIRDPNIDPKNALVIKRRIDASNQDRTDMVEYIDSYLLEKYKEVKPIQGARLNTETPAWSIDRLSILALKIYHMRVEALRVDATPELRLNCEKKFSILLVQRQDLSKAIEELIEDIEAGRKYMKVYKQMKMYNDPLLNPVLYKK
ncbi:MAG: DUF4254 domain-containing protein [Bacteroidetes bacterium]|nr:DUF4254 domain-containing protein [Bacteroidota bacterium]